MQVCPAFSSLPRAMRCAARSMSAKRSTMAGDLPPSSNVTGVRLPPAASRPPADAVEPVKKRWSNGSAAKALAISSSAGHDQSAAANLPAMTSCSSAEKRGISSHGLIITRLPAASAATTGASVSCSG